jgi:hypothetical protein
MKQTLLLVLAISAGVLLAQDNNAPKGPSQNNTRPATQQTVVRGCVSRLNGDFVLMRQDPAMTYELHSTGKVKLGHYLGRQVEVAGEQSPSLTTSSDSLRRTRSFVGDANDQLNHNHCERMHRTARL